MCTRNQRREIRKLLQKCTPVLRLEFVQYIDQGKLCHFLKAYCIFGSNFRHKVLRTAHIHQCLCQRKKGVLYSTYISRNIPDHSVQCKQDRHLDDQLQTASHRIYAIFLINSLCLLIHLHHGCLILSLILIFLLNCLQLRIHLALQLRKLLLLNRQRHQKHIDYNGK